MPGSQKAEWKISLWSPILLFPLHLSHPQPIETLLIMMGFPGDSAGKEPTCNAGDLGLIPGLGRSPGEGKGYPLQYSSLEKSMDCIVHGVAMSQTQLINFHFSLSNNNRSSIYMLLLLLLSRLSHVQLCATPQTAAHQAPPSMGFSRREYWSGLPLPSPSIYMLLNCGVEEDSWESLGLQSDPTSPS